MSANLKGKTFSSFDDRIRRVEGQTLHLNYYFMLLFTQTHSDKEIDQC